MAKYVSLCLIGACMLGQAFAQLAPIPDAPLPENPSVMTTGVQTMASGGGGCWSLDYNYLGCADSTLNCQAPVNSCYSPEASPGFFTAPGAGRLQVRLYLPFSNTNYDLYVERYIVNKWTVVYSSASPNTNNEQVTFTTIPGASYRFRAVRRFGTGYYTMNWKYMS